MFLMDLLYCSKTHVITSCFKKYTDPNVCMVCYVPIPCEMDKDNKFYRDSFLWYTHLFCTNENSTNRYQPLTNEIANQTDPVVWFSKMIILLYETGIYPVYSISPCR